MREEIQTQYDQVMNTPAGVFCRIRNTSPGTVRVVVERDQMTLVNSRGERRGLNYRPDFTPKGTPQFNDKWTITLKTGYTQLAFYTVGNGNETESANLEFVEKMVVCRKIGNEPKEVTLITGQSRREYRKILDTIASIVKDEHARQIVTDLRQFMNKSGLLELLSTNRLVWIKSLHHTVSKDPNPSDGLGLPAKDRRGKTPTTEDRDRERREKTSLVSIRSGSVKNLVDKHMTTHDEFIALVTKTLFPEESPPKLSVVVDTDCPQYRAYPYVKL